MLDAVRPEWAGTSPDNGVMPVDSTSEFYRLWSGLQFVCCLPTGENELSNHELFGDGLFWAGCTIIHFLGQQHRFEVFDFSYHILNVEESASVPCTNASIHQFFKKVTLIRDLNQTIFNTLRAYCLPPQEEPLVLHPPRDDRSDQFISSAATTGQVTTVHGRPVTMVATLREKRESHAPSVPPHSASAASFVPPTNNAPPPSHAPPHHLPPSHPVPPPPPRNDGPTPPPRNDGPPPPPRWEPPPPPPMDDLPPPPPPRDDFLPPPNDFSMDDMPPPPPPRDG